ncbi:MAG TPA: hypothetical protein VLT33_28695 [Labilithrix sp.]|nr:hypothetical protein [Labilithrix sp.]
MTTDAPPPANDATTPSVDATVDASDGALRTDAAAADASADATADASAADAATPVGCLDPARADYKMCAWGNCWGRCTAENDGSLNACGFTCNPTCAPDPVLAGACPPECNGGCADGACHINCVAGDDTCANGNTVPTWPEAGWPPAPHVICPEGLPCKVSCAGGGCSSYTISCPSVGSCAIDCVGGNCTYTHFFCGTGACTLSAQPGWAGGSRRHPYRVWNYASDVCGSSCDCTVPFSFVTGSAQGNLLPPNGCGPRGAPPRNGSVCREWSCTCTDGTIVPGGGPGGWCIDGLCSTQPDACALTCDQHGGWAGL